MDYLPLAMFPALFALILLGFPIAFSLIGVALAFGYFTYQDVYVYQLIGRVESISSNFILAAVPLFIFMGSVLERSGSPSACSMPSACGHAICRAGLPLRRF
jgi:TRAP-type mannitol/chloroaromatic compound transport system permease large subunit